MLDSHSFEGQTTTLAASTATELLGATGFDLAPALGARGVGFLLTNNGANPITALSAYWSLDSAGARWSTTADASIALPGGSLAAGASVFIERPGVIARRMRLVATSAAGTTCVLDLGLGRAGA